MKFLIFAGANGKLDLVKELLDKYSSLTPISVGDFNLFSPSSNVEDFCATKFIGECNKSKERLTSFEISDGGILYHIYGSRDDISNTINYVQKGIALPISNIEFGESEKLYILPGYHNTQNFMKDPKDHPKRKLMLNKDHIKSLTSSLKKKEKFPKVLISYESPLGFPFEGRGSKAIEDLIPLVDLWIYGHHNILSITEKIIGIPNIERCFCTLDLQTKRLEIHHRMDENENYELYQTIKIKQRSKNDE